MEGEMDKDRYKCSFVIRFESRYQCNTHSFSMLINHNSTYTNATCILL